MKALIIILALVGLTFIGLLVYGVSRDEQPVTKSASKKTEFPDGDEPPDSLVRLAAKTRGLTARFAPDLDLKEPGTLSTVPGREAPFPVAASPTEKARAAHIELEKGDWAIAALRNWTGTQLEGSKPLCLCREDVPLNAALVQACGVDWAAERTAKSKPGQSGVCRSQDWRGIIPVQEDGGLIVLLPGPTATVSIR